MAKAVKQESLMLEFAQRLLKATEGCRPDMHEPDENEVGAEVSGNHLDNAHGDDPSSSELCVTIHSGGLVRLEQYHFNLATLIAYARLGARVALQAKEIDTA